MITKITGVVNRVLDEEVRLQIGPIEYQIMVPECVRRNVQGHVGGEVTFHIREYVHGTPVKEIADAIQRQDHRWLSTLPGVGSATSEKIVATLRKKVTKFALMPTRTGEGALASGTSPAQGNVDGQVLEDSYQALLSVGHG